MRCPSLTDLPPPPEGKKGWPWTEETPRLPAKIPDGKPWPRISIVTPSYNQGQFIEETIRSVLLQGYPDLEYIIMDGGSTDESVEIIQKYEPWITFWLSESDGGQTEAINKGCRLATGDIIAYINSDDIYCPLAISKVVNYFMKFPDVAMVYGDALHIDRKGILMSIVRTGEVDLAQYLSNLFYLPQPAIFFRRQILGEIGYFDTRYNLAMDKEFWTRVLLNFKGVYLPDFLAKLRIYTEAKSSSQKSKYLEEHLMILDWVFSNMHLLHDRKDLPADIAKQKQPIYGSTFFTGGLEYLKTRQIRPAWDNIMKGLRLNPGLIFTLPLYWSLFTALFGHGLSSRIQSISKYYHNLRDPAFVQLSREHTPLSR